MPFLYALLALLVFLVAFDRLAPAKATRLALRIERWRSGLRLRHSRVSGFDMPFLAGGTGEPLVLIHGFAGDKDNFTRVARFLTPHYHVICPDLPGFGDAGRNLQANYSMTDQVERIHVFLDQLSLPRVHLGGNSMGGFIAAQFAATYPERVITLWLLDAAGTQAAHDSELMKHAVATGETPLLMHTEADFSSLMRASTHRMPFLPYSVRTTLARRGVADRELHTKILTQLAQSPLLESRYQALTTPTLIVWGAEDQILAPNGAGALNALFTDSQVHMLPGLGHLPMVEAPKQTATDYLTYQQTLRERTRAEIAGSSHNATSP
jgi:pimeloyl-ACP methyl ester carboxylesterase